MSKSERITSSHRLHRFLSAKNLCNLWLVLLFVFVTSGCRRDMQDQPKMKPLRGTTFFGDGLSARQPIQGTVARGFLRADTEFFTGKKSGTTAAAAPAQTQPPGQLNSFPDDIDYFPIPITEDVVKLGRDAVVCSSNRGAGSLGHHRLRPRAAGKPKESRNAIRKPRTGRFAHAGAWRTPVIQTFNPPSMSDFQKRALIAGGLFLLALLV